MQNVYFHVIAVYHKYMYNKGFIKMTTIEDLYSDDNKKKEQTTWTGADPGLFTRGGGSKFPRVFELIQLAFLRTERSEQTI